MTKRKGEIRLSPECL